MMELNDDNNGTEKQAIKLFVATPCFGGLISNDYMLGLLDLQRKCFEKGITIKIFTLGNESLITRARNICVAAFLDDPEEFTHLLFIDADIGFKPENVFRLIELDQEVSSGVYPKKDINWNEVLRLAKDQNINARRLEAEALMYNISFPDSSRVAMENGFVETVDGATGFMLLKREVFKKMKEGYPELKYNSDHWINSKKMESENCYLFFDCIKDPESGRYLSEDYTFCRRWRKIGGKIYSDIAMPLTHIGTYHFKGHVAAKFKRKDEV